MKMILFTVLAMMASFVSAGNRDYTLCVNHDELYHGVVRRENRKMDVNAVGDKHLRNKAYGLLQIRQPYLDDVNRIAGGDVKRIWGLDRLTIEDMKNPEKARWAFHVYLWHYGNYYKKVTGKSPTLEVYARIHNGGPKGWKKEKTVSYARDVMSNIMKYREKTL